MSMLYVWHPGVSDDATDLDAILTRGDSDQVGSGSERFVTGIVRALTISSLPEGSSTKPYRCNFYSEYWQSGGWENQWDFVWRLSAHFNKPIALKKPVLGYIGIDEIDDYSAAVESYKHSPFNCLVVAAFVSEKHAHAAAHKLVNDKSIREARRAVTAPDPSIDVLRLAAKQFHVRAAIGNGDEAFFRGEYPASVVSMFASNGGTIHTEN